jgi:intermembrane space import and assembly protein 40
MSTLADLAAEALGDANGDEDIEKQIEQALNCPCIGAFHHALPSHSSSPNKPETTHLPAPLFRAGDLKEGPCGQTFVTAFSCYIRSSHPEKGMDCLDQFKGFQECLKQHPDHVDKIMQDAEEEAINSNHSEETNTCEAAK